MTAPKLTESELATLRRAGNGARLVDANEYQRWPEMQRLRALGLVDRVGECMFLTDAGRAALDGAS